MGCDIHMCVERKIGNEWHTAWDGDIQPMIDAPSDRRQFPIVRARNYGLFADLAGVRGDGPEPKGLPDDLSPLTEHIVHGWGEDGHSHTWYYMDEFCAIWDRPDTDEAKLQLVKDTLQDVRREPTSQKLFGLWPEDQNMREYRVVIWFDN